MNKKLSIIVPVYNEVKTVLIILNKLKKLNLPNNYESEIIVVDDNSRDGTVDLLKKFELDNQNIKFIYKTKNKGKGHSQKIAKPYVTGDYIIIQDADLEYDPNDIVKLLDIAINQDKEFVIGYRDYSNALKHPYFFLRGSAVFFLTMLINILYGTKIIDSACCYRLFKASIWQSIDGKAEKFEYDFSIICRAILKTKKIGQCHVNYKTRSYEEGKKCTWEVGFFALRRIILDRFFSK